MSLISASQIKIGHAPDFVMRLGKMDIYHKENLYFFSQERQLQYPDVISNRSLHEVAKATHNLLITLKAKLANQKT